MAIGWSIVILLVIYLLSSFLIRGKVKSIEDLWVTSRNTKWWMFTGTLVATYVSMWTFMAGVGLSWTWGPMPPMLFYTSSITFGWMISIILIGYRLRKLNYNSITEFFKDRFGDNPVLMAGVSFALIGSLFFFLLIQIQGGGIILSTVFPLSYNTGLLIMSIIVFITVSLAGMWSVIITDTLSLIIFIVVLLTILPISIKLGGGVNEAISSIGNAKLWSATGASGLNMGYFAGYAMSWLAIMAGSPQIINRSLCVDKPKTVLKGTFIAYILCMLLLFSLFLSGSILAGVIPKGTVKTADAITPYAAVNVWPKFLGIFMILGAMAASFTTANTVLMTGSIAVADAYRFIKKKEIDIRRGKLWVAFTSLAILILSFIVAAKSAYLMAIGSSLAGIIFSLGVTPVMLLTIYWKRVTRQAVNLALWLSVPIGLFFIITNKAFGWFAPFPTLYSFPLGFILLVVFTFLTKQKGEEIQLQKSVYTKLTTREMTIALDGNDKITLVLGSIVAVAGCLLFILLLF